MTPDEKPTPLDRLKAFINHETTAGLILVLAAIVAIAAYNSPQLRPYYNGLLEAPVTLSIGEIGLSKPLLLWINDGLMAIFFFLVGLEIKREVLEGNLSSRDQIILPAMAAVGGMTVPALVYCYITLDSSELLRGWAIPAATDIAFALGALSLAGNRVPLSLKVFLLTLATLDDLGAIAIIALFYASKLSVLSLALAVLVLVLLVALNRCRVDRTALYILSGTLMWVFVLKSGVHATLAGVALALTIPLNRSDGTPFLHALEQGLHPYVTFLILPLFAFANSGIPLEGFSLDNLAEPLPLGIAAGLFVGKPLGVLLAVLAATTFGWARLPEGCSWHHIVGLACLAGIGFTMSLFIGSLAFEEAVHQTAVRVGVITGSVLSVVLGLGILLSSRPARVES